jgi:hypothetical protein
MKAGADDAGAGLLAFAQLSLADWTASQRLTWASGSSRYPDLVVNSTSGDLHVVWEDSTSGDSEIYHKKSTDGGVTWTTSQRLTWTSGYSGVPAIAVDSSGQLHVVWYHDTAGNYEIYYKKSTDGGTTWTISQRLTWTPEASGVPAISADSSGGLHVFWHDLTPGYFDIYYKKSTDCGATWTTSQRLTWTESGSYNAAVAVDPNDGLHVAWRDYTPGNQEIYYKKSTDSGASWTAARDSLDCRRFTLPAWLDPSATSMSLADETPGTRSARKSTDGAPPDSKQRLTGPHDTYGPAMKADSSGHLSLV